MISNEDARDDLYRKLLICDVARHLPGEALDDIPALTAQDATKLVVRASALALSDNSESKTLAYEIVTRIIGIFEDVDPRSILAAEGILARLGNFPGRDLLRKRYRVSRPGSIYVALEAACRAAENTTEGVERPLTDFQAQLLSTIASTKYMSVSAPTSAGKSFVLALDIVRRLKHSRHSSIVYVVPTRALIRQVMLKVSRELNGANLRQTAVRCVPLPVRPEDVPNGLVYVLTQERLMSLLHSDEGAAWITALIIDEAQGIKDGSRGIVLQTAIDTAISQNPMIDVVFASPLARNPEYLLSLFNRNQQMDSFTETHSPVSQNRIVIEPNGSAPIFTLKLDNDSVKLGRRRVPGLKLSGKVHERRAVLATAVNEPGSCTIVYENRPDGAEETAQEIAKRLPDEVIDPEIREFIDFLSEHIHPEYPLISVLKKRVAFHFGDMPPIVRSRVEDLASTNKLHYITCTSTLLQGVNLPARNIIIESPTKGQGRKMEKADFENLAGRAGRLLKEFHGNVWCINPSKWDNDCLDGDRLQEITSAFTNAIQKQSPLLEKALANETELKEQDRDLATAALGKLFAEYIIPGIRLEDTPLWNPEYSAQMRSLTEKCARVAIRLPPAIFSRNSTIAPTKLESLYDFLSAQQEIKNWAPLLWNQEGSHARMVEIFKVIWRIFEGQTSGSYEYHAGLASAWIRDIPLKRMISNYIDRLRNAPPEFRPPENNFVGRAIRLLMHDIESLLRYKYVKGLKAYNDVLRFVLMEKGERELAEKLVPLHLFLECGASDPVALGLISIGLSRTTALLLKNQIPFPPDATPERCKAILRGTEIAALKIPPLCLRELRDVLA